MTTNAACLVDDLGPLNRTVLWFFEHGSSTHEILARANYITQRRKEKRHLAGIRQPDGFETLSRIDK
jgi:hypothetical protein